MSLTSCFKKAGAALRAEDKAAIFESARQFRAQGMKANEAGAKAIAQQLGSVRDAMTTAQQPKEALAQPARGTYSPDTKTITLLKDNNLSTVLHELGHHFLDMQAYIAAQPNAPAGVRQDMGALLKWFGVQGTDGVDALTAWHRMTLDEQRESHEKFARGFETYLFSGKAPSVELQGPFQRYRAWLLNVYQEILRAARGNLEKALNVKLTDEVRGVMDRMLATEQEIQTAEAAASMGMMFKTPEEAQRFGLDWSAYQALGVAATDAAIDELGARSLKDMQWRTNAKARILKGLQKDAAEKRKEMRREVTTQVMSRPIYQAWQALTGKAPAALEKSEAEIASTKAREEWKDDRAEAEAEAQKSERVAMAATQPNLKGIEKGQFLAKNKRQIGINVDQRMLEWDKAHPQPEFVATPAEEVEPGLIGKLDSDTVKNLHPAAFKALKERKMLAVEGVQPDVAADVYGFASGDEMVQALATVPTPREAIETATDAAMLAKYGDITSPEALEAATNEAIHNDMRQRVVASELSALERAMSPRQVDEKTSLYRRRTLATLPAAAKKLAFELVARLRVKDIKPHLYEAAEARASRNATKALKAGDVREAAEQKRNQLVNGYAVKAATDGIAEAQRIMAFMRRVNQGNLETVTKNRDAAIVQAMRAIIADYGIGSKGEAAQNYLRALEQHDPDTYRVLRDKVDAMTAAARPVQEMPLEALRGLHDELQSMWYLAERGREIEIDGALVKREAVQQELAARMDEIGIPDRVPGEGMAVTDSERRLTMLQTAVAALRRVESWVGVKDGGISGPFRKFIWQPIREAADRYRLDRAKYLRRYRDLLLNSGIDFGRSRIDAPELGYVFGMSRGGSGKQELLHAILHTGNESSNRKLLLGRGWATLNEDGTLDTSRWDAFVSRMQTGGVLGKAEYDFAQGVWDLLEDIKPLAQKTHRSVFGSYFAEVTAEAFATPYGTYRGGYVPALTDSEVVKDAKTRELMEQENQTLAFAFPSTSKGFTKGRVEYNKALLLDLRSLSQHIDKVLLFSHMEQPIRDVRKVLTSGDVAEPLNRIDPTAFDGLLTPWMNRTARQQVETPVPGSNGLMRYFAKARQRAGLAALFANVSNTAQQITGLSIAALRVKPSHLLSAAAQSIHSPRSTAAAVAAASPYMQTRMDSEVAQMTDAINDILLNPSVYERAQSWTAKHAYFMQSAVDNFIGPIVWNAAYNQALGDGTSEQDAIRRADSAVRETQGSSMPEDIARIETGNAFVRMFSQFAGYFNMQANLMGSEFVKAQHELGLRKGMGRGIYIFTFGFLAPALVSELIVQAFRGGPDDDDKDGSYLDDWLAALGIGTLRSGLAMAPVVGPVISALFNTFNKKPYDDRISTSPAVSMIESAVSAPKSVYEAVVHDGSAKKAVRDVATLITMTTGLPANAVARPLGYVADVSQGKINPTGPVDVARGLVSGSASPESKR